MSVPPGEAWNSSNAPSESRWVPLVLALEWNEANPDDPPDRSGPDLLRELIQHLTGKQVAPAEPGAIMGCP